MALDPPAGKRDGVGGVYRSAKLQRAARPGGVVVVGVLGDVPQVPLVEDQQAIDAFGSRSTYEPLRVSVHPRRLWRALEDVDAVGGEDCVECLGVAVVQAGRTLQLRQPYPRKITTMRGRPSMRMVPQ
jgi:hypothetical protein